MADSRESLFQRDIIDAMVTAGWLEGHAGNYDRANALYPEDLVGDGPGAQPLDAMGDNEKLSLPLLESEEAGKQFALLILRLLSGRLV